jgi:hypothetical protein
MASILFNKLPERIRILEILRSFKKEVKILLFTKTFYSVDEFYILILVKKSLGLKLISTKSTVNIFMPYV